MIYNIYPTKDATLYDYSASMNTGNDPILEVEKTNTLSTGIHLARAIIQFDWATASSSLETLPRYTSNGADYKLKLYTSKAKEIPYSYKLEAIPIQTQDWQMGIGKRSDTPVTTKGVSWGFTDYSGSTDWLILGGTTGSTIVNQTQSFEFESTDVEIDVSESVRTWEVNPNVNKGLLLQYSGGLETDTLSYGNIQFFSRDTNTIYSPRIQVGYDDSVWNTGSMDPVTSDEILVYIKNNKYEYQETEVARFEVRSRDVYTTQTYATTSAALTNYYLPTGSYYSIKDAETEESVIDFNSSYTKVSCTGSGNFFDIAMKSLTPERLYKIVIKVEDRNYVGQVEYFDSNHVFKVVR